MASSAISKLSDELSAAVEQAGSSVVTVFARRRLPSSGILWRKDVIVTANHAIQREEEISLLLPGNKKVTAKLAGRDPGTDLAILKLDNVEMQVPEFGDPAQLKLANLIL